MRLLVGLALLMIVVACAVESDNTAKGAQQAFEAYVEALNSGNFDAAAEFYDDQDGFHWIERGGVQYETGTEASESLRALSSAGGSPKMTLGEIRVARLDSNAALVSAQFDFQMLSESNEEQFAFDGWMTVGMVRRKEGWRIAGGQTGPGSDE